MTAKLIGTGVYESKSSSVNSFYPILPIDVIAAIIAAFAPTVWGGSNLFED